eukprot:CAMPEP_0183605434 /NCGR_PEP_ID=MMETSP0371-20130417/182451_1 /TAXON_ID=268820 /ORGANISM="Peridinium aciculiferum, Strain PAER-2" /LENGTH=116 /DNA_ID=CAMNT_0025817541 /DNA_START=730 /DNA_END=1075 /DNA_ORIENTATION=+
MSPLRSSPPQLSRRPARGREWEVQELPSLLHSSHRKLHIGKRPQSCPASPATGATAASTPREHSPVCLGRGKAATKYPAAPAASGAPVAAPSKQIRQAASVSPASAAGASAAGASA